MHWGRDFCEFIERESELKTEIISLYDVSRGICGEYADFVISRKETD